MGQRQGLSQEARVLDAPQESKLSLWGGGEPGVGNLMKRLPTLVPTQENQRISLRGRRPPWAPTSCCTYGLHPGSPGWSAWLEQREWLQRDLTNHLGSGKGGQRGQDRRPGKTPCWPSLAQVS